MNIRQALQLATGRLRDSGLRTPRQDAEALLMGVLEIDRARLFAYPERILKDGEQRKFQDWLSQRQRHYPIQYLRGRQEFYGRDFLVTPDVLVPRPETELLVEAALEFLGGLEEKRIEVVEVGLGSGCLGLTLCCEDPRVRLTGIDISLAALQVARRNAQRLGCMDRTSLLQADTLNALSGSRSCFALLVSNPPYGNVLRTEDVDPGVLQYEPSQAVLAGPTGMEIHEAILSQAGKVLRKGGGVLLEIGVGQAPAVVDWARRNRWQLAHISRDLAGIDRCLFFRREDGQQVGSPAKAV